MYKIVTRRQLNDAVVLMEIDAPYIAAKAEAGQFIIYRVDEKGERVPLTIADYDREKGTITIIFQVVGASTTELARLNEGDYIHDVVGPLGVATEDFRRLSESAESPAKDYSTSFSPGRSDHRLNQRI